MVSERYRIFNELIKFMENVNWWGIVKDNVLPHLGTIILSLILFISIGFILGIIYNVILWKKKVYTREPKYYNWGVKLYILASMIAFVYFFAHFAIISSARKIIKKEEPRIVSEIYEQGVKQIFNSPEERNKFIKKIQDGAGGIQQGSKQLTADINKYVASKNIGFQLIDNGKNKLSNYLTAKYQDDIYSAGLYGMLLAAGRGHVDLKSLSYEDFNMIVKTLNRLDPRDIEKSIKLKLTEEVDGIVSKQMDGLFKGALYLFIAILLVPLVEFFIYRHYAKRQLLKQAKVPAQVDLV